MKIHQPCKKRTFQQTSTLSALGSLQRPALCWWGLGRCQVLIAKQMHKRCRQSPVRFQNSVLATPRLDIDFDALKRPVEAVQKCSSSAEQKLAEKRVANCEVVCPYDERFIPKEQNGLDGDAWRKRHVAFKTILPESGRVGPSISHAAAAGLGLRMQITYEQRRRQKREGNEA